MTSLHSGTPHHMTREEWQKQRLGCVNLHQGVHDSEWCITVENGQEIKGYCGYVDCPRVTGRV